MDFRTLVDIPAPPFRIAPLEKVLCIGSCFADRLGERFERAGFAVVRNPFGVMYNPVSVWHTVDRTDFVPDTAVITLGTNRVYRWKETGEIVDNCGKRPASLFQEEALDADTCAAALRKSVDRLRERNPQVKVVLTVSPIRYRKYGYHGSRLSKAVLLLAADRIVSDTEYAGQAAYFPSYEIMNDELRDYRFYAPDMLHPSEQAVDYIWERFRDSCLSDEALAFLREWLPTEKTLAHRPFDADNGDYRRLMEETRQKREDILRRYGKNNQKE